MRQFITRLFVALILVVGSAPHADAAPGHGGEHGDWHSKAHDHDFHDFHGPRWNWVPGGLPPDRDLDVSSVESPVQCYCPNPPGYYPTVLECIEPWIPMH